MHGRGKICSSTPYLLWPLWCSWWGLAAMTACAEFFRTIFQAAISALTTTQLGLIVTASYIGNLVFFAGGRQRDCTRFSKKARAAGADPAFGWPRWQLFAFTSNYYRCCSSGMALRAWVLPRLLNTTMNLITPLLFAHSRRGSSSISCSSLRKSAPAAASILLGQPRQRLLPSGSTTNLVLLILGAVAFVLLLRSAMCRRKPPPRRMPRHKKAAMTGVSSCRYVLVFGFYFIAEHGVMNWMVAYGVDGSGPAPGLGGQVSFGVLSAV